MRRRDLLLSLPAAAWAATGSVAPDFEFINSKGEKESLGKYRGKTVALYFFNPG